MKKLLLKARYQKGAMAAIFAAVSMGAIIGGVLYSPLYSKGSKEAPGFYNEALKYNIELKGFVVGSVLMRTITANERHLQINASVESFDAIKGVYYIKGTFGALWNYNTRSSYVAYEDVYQGFDYQRRAYRFEGDQVFVSKLEKTFSEAGHPHTGPIKKSEAKEYYLQLTDYHDLLGVFYWMRTSGKLPNVGDVTEIKVLPSGVKKIMVMKVIDKKTIDVPALGGSKRVFHVRTGLKGVDEKVEGGDIFFTTTSIIDLYITEDENFIPVKMWTSVPVLGQVDIVLAEYAQPRIDKGKKK